MSDRKIVADFLVQTGQSRQNLEEVQNALANSGDAGTRSASAITNALQNVENAEERVNQKIADGRTVSVRDGNVMIQQFTLLKQAIEQAFGSISNAPVEVQQAFTKAENQFKSTTTTIKNLTTAATENKQAIAGNAAQWGGFEQQLLKMVGADGALGKLLIGFVGVKAALTEGWQIGTRFATAMGTSFDAATSAASNFKTSISSVLNTLVSGEGLWATFQQGRAHLKNLGDTLFGTGLQMQGFNALIASGVDRTTALKVSTDDLRAVTYAHELAVKGGAEGLKLFDTVIRSFDPKEYASRLGDLRQKFVDLATAHGAEVEKQKAHEDAIKSSITTIDNYIKKLEAEKEARKRGLDVLDAEILEHMNLDAARKKTVEIDRLAQNVTGGLTDAMREELGWLQKLVPNFDQNTAKVNEWSNALKGDVALHKDAIEPTYRKHLEEIVGLIENYGKAGGESKTWIALKLQDVIATGNAAAASAAHNTILQTGKTSFSNVNEEAAKSPGILDAHKKATDASSTAVSGFGVNLGDAEQKLIDVEGPLRRLGGKQGHFAVAASAVADLTKEINDLNAAMDRTADRSEVDAQRIRTAFVTAMNDINRATKAAAGSGGSWPKGLGPGDPGSPPAPPGTNFEDVGF